MSLSSRLFLHKNSDTIIELRHHESKEGGFYVLDIGDITIYNPEIIKNQLIAELNKIEASND